jgi:hypothetical protein
MSRDAADIYSTGGSRSDFFHASGRDTVIDVAVFVALLSLIVSVASVTFGWAWIPRMFLGFLALSVVLLVRSRALGRQPGFYDESVHLTTATFGLLSILVLLALQLG